MNRHIPVLLDETIAALQLKPGMHVIDCTLGDAGHAESILAATAPDGRLLGIDADPESLLRAKQFLREYAERIIFVRDNFESLADIVGAESFPPPDAILFDLGWSSPQFAERGRGFSFERPDEPLDMRYDTRMDCEHTAKAPEMSFDGKPLYGRCTAAELVNHKSEKELEQIFRTYGEEKLAKRIAAAIVEKRKAFALETVGDLVDIVLDVYRQKLKTDKEIPWVGGIHPATKVFQALRIAVNDELGVLKRVLPTAVDTLAPGGKIAVISFHSVEDGIVKHFFKSQKNKTLRVITKKPIVAGEREREENPRARSAKLRVAQKI
jgi:16S rRNA (cytosine1402-N4)-methyltransferase